MRLAFLLALRIALLGGAARCVACTMTHEGGGVPTVGSGSSSGETTGSGSGSSSGSGSGSGSGAATSGGGSGAMAISGGQSGMSGTAPDAGAGTGSTSDAGGAVSDLACGTLSSTACDTCCTNNHPVGAQVYQDAIDNCICGPPNGTNAVCQTQCALTDCSSDPDAGSSVPGDPCDLCQNAATDDAGACASQLYTACRAVPDCVGYSACEDNCP